MVVVLVSDEYGINGGQGVVVAARGKISRSLGLLGAGLYAGAMTIGERSSLRRTFRKATKDPQHLLAEVGAAVNEEELCLSAFGIRICFNES